VPLYAKRQLHVPEPAKWRLEISFAVSFRVLADHSVASPERSRDQTGIRASLEWRPRADIDRAEWSAAGRRLGAVTRCSKWWIGDWLNYGNHRWGEKYRDAARITGYDIQTLKNMAHVAAQFAPYLRRYDLTWSHHAVLAPLGCDERSFWLDRASAERLSIADLKLELKTSERTRARETRPASTHAEEREAICPRCEHKFAFSAMP
jgi:hypothetical protein